MLFHTKWLILSVVVCCLLSFNLTTAQADNCKSFSGNGINNWYPFSYRNDDGKLTGIMVDGMLEALRRVNAQLKIHNDKPWKRIMYDLENGNVDMVLGAYWNSERAQKYHYSEQMGTDELRIFVKAGNEFTFNNFEDLIGRSGMRLLGGSLGDEFDSFAKKYLDFNEVPRSDTMITMLINDRSDYGILGYVEGLKFINSLGVKGEIMPLPKAILSHPMHVLINKNADCVGKIDEVNSAIKDMKSDGTLDKIIAHHLGLITKYAQ